MSRILIITESPFSKRDYDRFGLALLSQNFQVSILDCTPWLKPDFWDKYSALVYRCPGYVAVTDAKSLASYIGGEGKTVAIDYLSAGAGAEHVRTVLRRCAIPRAIVYHGLLPTPAIKWSERAWKLVSSRTPRSLLTKIRNRGKQILRPESAPPEIALLSGIASLKDKSLRDVPHKIWAHSFDYDVYLECSRQAAAPVAPYAVFLDEDIIYHSDYDHLGVKVPTTEAYYGSMNGFFQKLERKLGLPVTVAAHPRSRYDLRPHLWNGRTVNRGATAQLIRDAALVLCHQSTAVSFAVLWRKPLIVLTTNDLERSIWRGRIALTSTVLRAPLVNVEGDDAEQVLELQTLFEVNEGAYAKYSEDYIKCPGTPELPSWRIFADYVQQALA